jgi:uncharacterized OB-fold protein
VSVAEPATPRPGTKVIRIAADGTPSIEAFRCPDCSAVTATLTMACRACGSRNPPQAFRSAEAGALYTWTVVQRSYPGIAVPFVSAIIDLDGGLSIKGTLRDVKADQLKGGMRLKLVFDDAGGAKADDGAAYIGFHFVPEGAAA